PSRGTRRIRARGIREPVLFAPRPHRKAQADEGGEEVRKVEVERSRSVTVAERQREVGAGAETFDLNRVRSRVNGRPASGETGMGCKGQGHERVGRRLGRCPGTRSEEHTSELQSRFDLVCRLLLEKKKA